MYCDNLTRTQHTVYFVCKRIVDNLHFQFDDLRVLQTGARKSLGDQIVPGLHHFLVKMIFTIPDNSFSHKCGFPGQVYPGGRSDVRVLLHVFKL